MNVPSCLPSGVTFNRISQYTALKHTLRTAYCILGILHVIHVTTAGQQALGPRPTPHQESGRAFAVSSGFDTASLGFECHSVWGRVGSSADSIVGWKDKLQLPVTDVSRESKRSECCVVDSVVDMTTLEQKRTHVVYFSIQIK